MSTTWPPEKGRTEEWELEKPPVLSPVPLRLVNKIENELFIIFVILNDVFRQHSITADNQLMRSQDILGFDICIASCIKITYPNVAISQQS